jgi:hypothetical protein
MALAFIAKAAWNFPANLAMIEYLKASKNLGRICGWVQACEIPSESTFSRAFDEFGQGQLPQQIHEVMIKKRLGDIGRAYQSRFHGYRGTGKADSGKDNGGRTEESARPT